MSFDSNPDTSPDLISLARAFIRLVPHWSRQHFVIVLQMCLRRFSWNHVQLNAELTRIDQTATTRCCEFGEVEKDNS